MKSAGISLLRVMRPAIGLALLTAAFSLISSNYIKPAATFQFKKRFDLIKRQKSTLTIEEGVFNDEFRDFAIRVEGKEADGKKVSNVIIYDHTLSDRSLVNFIKSDCGEMYSTEDGNYFVMNLQEGEQYQELDRKIDNGRVSYPFIRTEFYKWSKVFDMSNFYLNESDVNISRNREDMLNTFQLLTQIDTFNKNIKQSYNSLKNRHEILFKSKILSESEYKNFIKVTPKNDTTYINNNPNPQYPTNVMVNKDSILKARRKLAKGYVNEQATFDIKNKEKVLLEQKIKNFKENPIHKISPSPKQLSLKIPPKEKPITKSENPVKRKLNFDVYKSSFFYQSLDSASFNHVIDKTVINLESAMSQFGSIAHNINYTSYQKEVYLLRLGQQYSFAIVCILFLFIGAPLGSIIRKGGYGYPLLIAILFYMMFIISTIVGEKLLKSESVKGLTGAWLPCMILLPFSFYFTYLALNDARFLWLEKLGRYLTKLFSPKEKSISAT
jgi:lipopolysaccharide export system permease protein